MWCMIFKNPDIRAGYREMMDAKEHFRSQKEIIRDLMAELAPVDEESFATHLSRLVMEMDSRAENPLFKHFHSPLKLITYLIDLILLYSRQVRDGAGNG